MQPKRPNAICRIPTQSFPAPNPKTLRECLRGCFFHKARGNIFIGNAHCGGTEYEKNSRNADNEPRGIKARGVHKLADKQVADSGKAPDAMDIIEFILPQCVEGMRRVT